MQWHKYRDTVLDTAQFKKNVLLNKAAMIVNWWFHLC